MAQETRAQLYAKILANLPDNTTEAITPATDRAVENAEVESCYNLLDDESTNVTYNPTSVSGDWLPEGDPTEVGGALDILADRTGKNLPNTVFYVCQDTANPGVTPEVGNPLKPFANITDAVLAMGSTPNNEMLKVLGGGTYIGNFTLPLNSVNCVFDFGQCTIQGTLTYQTSIGNNGSIVKNLNINNTTGATSRIDAEFIENVNHTGTGAIFVDSKYCYNSSFVSSSSTVTIATSNITEVHYLVACRIQNTGTGSAIYRSANSVFLNCSIESNTGVTYTTSNVISTIQQVSRFYNCEIKGQNICVSGENGDTNIIAYNTKFYSVNSNIIQQGGSSFGKFLNFEGCEFYTKGALDVFNMLGTAVINRTAQENYTFKNCVFHTVTGFPINEPTSYNASDAGRTLLVNCVYNASQATNGAPIAGKIQEHNSFQDTNYTDFNNLQ